MIITKKNQLAEISIYTFQAVVDPIIEPKFNIV